MSPCILPEGPVAGLTAVLVLCAAAVLLFFAPGCTKELKEENLFFPQPVPPAPAEDGRKDVHIEIDDSTALHGWYFYDPARTTTLLYFYGNGETTHSSHYRATWLARELGVNVMVIDYRGYGYSGGTPGVETMIEDSLRVYDAVALNSPAPQRIAVFGRSIGTAPAIHIAAHRDVEALILEAPFTTINDIIAAWDQSLSGPVGWFVTLRPEKKLSRLSPQPEELMADIDVPLLILHGTADTIIPVALGRKMYERSPGEQKTWCEVDGIGHNNLSLTDPGVEPALREFAEAYLAPPGR